MKLYFEREQLKWDFAKLSLSVREQLKSNCAGNGGRRQTIKKKKKIACSQLIIAFNMMTGTNKVFLMAVLNKKQLVSKQDIFGNHGTMNIRGQ